MFQAVVAQVTLWCISPGQMFPSETSRILLEYGRSKVNPLNLFLAMGIWWLQPKPWMVIQTLCFHHLSVNPIKCSYWSSLVICVKLETHALSKFFHLSALQLAIFHYILSSLVITSLLPQVIKKAEPQKCKIVRECRKFQTWWKNEYFFTENEEKCWFAMELLLWWKIRNYDDTSTSTLTRLTPNFLLPYQPSFSPRITAPTDAVTSNSELKYIPQYSGVKVLSFPLILHPTHHPD